MTFSVLALDRESGAIGCAAATGNLAVGAWVLRAAAKVGAVATQGFSVSSIWGDAALARLAQGESAEQVVAHVTDPDPGRDHRQLAVLDATGRVAAWTGEANRDAKGHRFGRDTVIAGNWLATLSVLDATQGAFDDCRADLGERLLVALEAGVAAGSDSRGTLSAAIQVLHPNRPPLDLRVDYDDAPLEKLRDLYRKVDAPPYSEWTRHLPTLDDPHRY